MRHRTNARTQRPGLSPEGVTRNVGASRVRARDPKVHLIDTGIAQVVPDSEHPARLTLLVNGVPSSGIDLADPGFLSFEYLQQMDAVLNAIRAGPVRALHLGAGGCGLARAWAHDRPGSHQLAVDIDGSLVRQVRGWFDLPRPPNLRIRVQDAAETIATARADRWDVIVRDVFAGDLTPDNLKTREFALGIRRALAPGGIYLANCADRPPLIETKQEAANLAMVFGPSAVAVGRLAVIAEVGVLKGRRFGNVVLAAIKRPGPPATPGRFTTENGNPTFLSPRLDRALRTLPIPAVALTGAELVAFLGSHRK